MKGEMRRTSGVCQLVLLACALMFEAVSCGGIVFGTETNTNFLDACNTDAECGGEDACRCGICTVSCEEDRDCLRGRVSGVCVSRDVCGATPVCLSETAFQRLDRPALETEGGASADVGSTEVEGATRSSLVDGGARLLSACAATADDYGDQALSNDETAFPAVRSIFTDGDTTTTICLDNVKVAGTLCVEGNGTDAGEQFQNWGAGIGLQLDVQPNDAGDAVDAWNATALGIEAVRFTITNLNASLLRVEVAQVADPAIASPYNNNYPGNPFVWGGSEPIGLQSGVTTVELAQFTMTSWGEQALEYGLGRPLASTLLEPAKLGTLQFRMMNAQGALTQEYSFCLSNLEWLDADGNVVSL